MQVTNFEHVKQAFDKVDPIGLLSAGAPDDEYGPEIEDIVTWQRHEINTSNLAEFMWHWFSIMPEDDVLFELMDRLIHPSGWKEVEMPSGLLPCL